MFCPKCGQERSSTDTSFCSRCGFLLTGTAELLTTGGIIPRSTTPAQGALTRRSKGKRTGVFIALSTLLIVPLLSLFTVVFNIRTPILPVLALILLVGGGILRFLYAVLFESNVEPAPMAATPIELAKSVLGRDDRPSLPQGTHIPADIYAPPATGRWNTSELDGPGSVTEVTTRHLKSDSQ